MKKSFLFLSALAALTTALVWLASPTRGDDKKAFPPFGKIDRIDPAFDKLIAPGAYLENLGTYNPTREPAEIKLDMDRVRYWMEKGAKPTETVSQLIKVRGKQQATAPAEV